MARHGRRNVRRTARKRVMQRAPFISNRLCACTNRRVPLSWAMRATALLLLALALGARLAAADFSARFDQLRAAASPAQLYALLYDLPKGGDLHNHAGGSDRPDWIFAACTDPARNGGDTFYTRARFAAQPDAIAPPQRFRTIRQHAFDRLSADARQEYVRLDALTPAERTE